MASVPVSDDAYELSAAAEGLVLEQPLPRTHWPLVHTLFDPQTVPQPPQLLGSASRFVHTLEPQHVDPGAQA